MPSPDTVNDTNYNPTHTSPKTHLRPSSPKTLLEIRVCNLHLASCISSAIAAPHLACCLDGISCLVASLALAAALSALHWQQPCHRLLSTYLACSLLAISSSTTDGSASVEMSPACVHTDVRKSYSDMNIDVIIGTHTTSGQCPDTSRIFMNDSTDPSQHSPQKQKRAPMLARSPKSSGVVKLAAIFRRIRRMILPLRVFGRPGAQ